MATRKSAILNHANICRSPALALVLTDRAPTGSDRGKHELTLYL